MAACIGPAQKSNSILAEQFGCFLQPAKSCSAFDTLCCKGLACVLSVAGLLHVHPILKHLPEAVRGLAAGMIGYITAPAGSKQGAGDVLAHEQHTC